MGRRSIDIANDDAHDAAPAVVGNDGVVRVYVSREADEQTKECGVSREFELVHTVSARRAEREQAESDAVGAMHPGRRQIIVCSSKKSSET